jgi:hypothetical protein
MKQMRINTFQGSQLKEPGAPLESDEDVFDPFAGVGLETIG